MSKSKPHPLYHWLTVSEDGDIFSNAVGKSLTHEFNSHGHAIVYEKPNTILRKNYGIKNRYYVAALVADTYLTVPEDAFRYTLVPVHLDGDLRNNRVDNIGWRSLVNKVNGEEQWEPIPVTLVDYIKLETHTFASKSRAAMWANSNMPTHKLPEVKYEPDNWAYLSYGRYQTIRTGFDDIVDIDDLRSNALCLVTTETDNQLYEFKSIVTLPLLERTVKEVGTRPYNEKILKLEMRTRRNQLRFVTMINDTLGVCSVLDYLEYRRDELGVTEFTHISHD